MLFRSEGPCYGLIHQREYEIVKERNVKKWIIAAGVVAAGLVAVIVVTKPWPQEGRELTGVAQFMGERGMVLFVNRSVDW